jgi:hypothetical protein
VTLQVLTATREKIAAFWDVASCRLVIMTDVSEKFLALKMDKATSSETLIGKTSHNTAIFLCVSVYSDHESLADKTTGYGLNDRGSMADEGRMSRYRGATGYGVHPASLTEGCFSKDKAAAG